MLSVAIKSLKLYLYVHFWCEPGSFFISKPSLNGMDDDLGSLNVSGSFIISASSSNVKDTESGLLNISGSFFISKPSLNGMGDELGSLNVSGSFIISASSSNVKDTESGLLNVSVSFFIAFPEWPGWCASLSIGNWLFLRFKTGSPWDVLKEVDFVFGCSTIIGSSFGVTSVGLVT